MEIVDLSAIAALLLAISLATERLVAVVKTILPTWFADEKKTEAREVDLIADRWRRLRVQAIAFAAAWGTASFLVEGGFNPMGNVSLGRLAVPAAIVGLLASGGSAFWAQIVGYAGALKDIATAQKASASLAFVHQAERMGITPADSGSAVRGAQDNFAAAEIKKINELRDSGPPRVANLIGSGGGQ